MRPNDAEERAFQIIPNCRGANKQRRNREGYGRETGAAIPRVDKPSASQKPSAKDQNRRPVVHQYLQNRKQPGTGAQATQDERQDTT